MIKYKVINKSMVQNCKKNSKAFTVKPVWISLLVSAFTIFSAHHVQADGLASDYDSLPPLITTAGANDRPNVLLMLDTSGSMDYDSDDAYVGPNHTTSRTVMSRQAIATLLERFGESVRMGLMAFEPAPSFNYVRRGTSPAQYWEGQNLGSLSNYAINRGYLYIPIGSVDSADSTASTVARISEFNNRLGLNVVTQNPPLTGYYNLFQLDNSNYTSSSDYANDRLVSNGGTPIAGTFRSALEYKRADLNLSSNHYLSGLSATDVQWPSDNICADKDYAILITDGLPSVNIAGEAGNERLDEFMPEVLAEAAALRDAGVTTYVIGFALPSGADYLHSIARAGSTDPSAQAYFAENVAELTAVLDGIFTDIVNRQSSGTGAAVVANRGNGLSADFQALYTPEKTYDGKTVKWVGTLHGFFIDENRKLREDTNQDGLLGDYTVDRILEFVYNENDKTTYVDRMISASATDPEQVIAGQTITTKIEDIASIWNARNQLAALNDVLTQRAYSASAAGGRRIYTTVDGETLLNFVQVDESLLLGLEGNEQGYRDVISALQTEIYGDATDPTASFLLGDLNDTLTVLNTLLFLTGDLDGVGEGSFMLDAFNLQQEIDSLRSSNATAIENAESDLVAAEAILDTESGDLKQAQTNLATEQSELATAQGVLDQAILDKAAADTARTTAETALTNAETNRDNAQQALTDANADQVTALSERDTANTAVTDANTAVSTAAGVVTQETTDRDDALNTRNNAVTAYNNAVIARDGAQTAYNTAVTAAGTEKTQADDALIVRNDAQGDLDAAQTAYDDAVATYPPMHPNIASARADLDDAQTAYDGADKLFQDENQQWLDAVDVVGDRQTDLTNAQNSLNTATTNRTTAQAEYDQAVLDLGSANSDLTDAQTALSDAEDVLEGKESALETANDNVTAANSDLTAAQAAVTAASTTVGLAITAQNDAQTAVNDATTTRNERNADVALAETAEGDAQDDYDAALAAVNALEAEIARRNGENGINSNLDETQAWLDSVILVAENLRTLFDDLDTLGSASSDARELLIERINTLFNELLVLVGTGFPAIVVSGDTADLITGVMNLVAEINDVMGNLNDQDASSPAEEFDSVAEAVANIHNKMSEKERNEGYLVNTDEAIDEIEYIRYMDDNIPAQATDVDLTYAERSDVVAWIRGEEVTGLRNRTIDFDEDGVDEVWRLADIVHSTPAVVGRPTGLYYSRYGDTTYRDYMEAKFNRRQVVYTGSNDGLLHAFNAGFWDDAQKGYVTQMDGETAHPLGSELWAYVPKAVLPHLQFVANAGYSHAALVDGVPQAFDVNIFPNDDVHPEGWGTILVVNMRMGGGDFTVRVDEDEDGTEEDVVVRPSVMIFDVTNPEADPILIAELSDPAMGFTLGKPALIKNRVASATGSWSSPSVNRWVLVFGSGPNDLDTATSNQQARMYAYDLSEREWAEDWSGDPTVLTLESNSFVGDPTTEDWDRDFVDDAVYFGLNTGTAAASDGQLARLELKSDESATSWLSNASVGTLSDVNRTVIGAPLTKSDVYGRRWVYFGTGRVLIASDSASSQQEYFFGVKEPIDSDYELTYNSVGTNTLLDITDIRVFTNPDSVEGGPAGVTNPSELIAYMNENNNGWVRELTDTGTAPSGRSDTRPSSYLEAVTFSEYIPSADQCNPEGESYVWTINYVTGVAFKENYLDEAVDQATGLTEILPSLNVGPGKVGDISNLPDGNLVMHDSTGRVVIVEPYQSNASLRRQSWRQIFNIEF